MHTHSIWEYFIWRQIWLNADVETTVAPCFKRYNNNCGYMSPNYKGGETTQL